MTKKNYYITLDHAGYNSMTKLEQHMYDYIREHYDTAVIGLSAIESLKHELESEAARIVSENPRWKAVSVKIDNIDEYESANPDEYNCIYFSVGNVNVRFNPVLKLCSIEQ